MPSPAVVRTGNRLLDALPLDVLRPMVAGMDETTLIRGSVLFDAQTVPGAVHFPVDTVVALVTPLAAGGSVEVATIGYEGIVGLPHALDGGETAVRALVRISGRALRMGADELERQVDALPRLGATLLRYTDSLFNQVAQTGACHRYHATGERLSRLLLMTQDRVRLDQYPMTQEFMAQMLGARRATVTLAAGTLQEAGLIRLHRGRVIIVDRAGLEAASCECYSALSRPVDRTVRTAASVSSETRARLQHLVAENIRLTRRLEELTAVIHGRMSGLLPGGTGRTTATRPTTPSGQESTGPEPQ